MTTSNAPPDNNPYIASEVMERGAEPSQRSQPGPIAIFFSVVLGMVVAVVVFAATFAVTCLGTCAVEQSDKSALDNEFAKNYLGLVIFGLPCITASAAFVFTLPRILKFGRATKKKH
jgi:hypothetical protein